MYLPMAIQKYVLLIGTELEKPMHFITGNTSPKGET